MGAAGRSGDSFQAYLQAQAQGPSLSDYLRLINHISRGEGGVSAG